MDANTQHILIAGGSGFLGKELKHYFEKNGKDVKILSRTPKTESEIYWDAQNLGDWITEIEWADVLINLTGKSVDCRYTQENKDLILSSRVDSTRILCKAVSEAQNPPQLWINSSSASTYVHSETQQMTEDEGIIGDDFSMNVCKKWEATFFNCNLNHTRRIATRTSIVLGKSGGAYPIFRKLTRLFMGGKQGNGNQFISWIHIHDFCKSYDFMINHPEIVGPVNVTSPTPIKNKEFMQKLRKRFNVFFGISQTKWMLEMGSCILRTETEMVLKSRNVIPERLIEAGFKFDFEEIDKTFENL